MTPTPTPATPKPTFTRRAHLFDVPGVIVVLAINRAELAHSVQSVYGPDFSADRYLRRFADLHARLLPPAQPELIPLFQQLRDEIGEDSLGDRGIWEMLSLAGEAEGCGLRDIQQAGHHYSAVLACDTIRPDPDGNLGVTIAALLVLRALDRESYRAMANGQLYGFQAIATLRRALTLANADRPSVPDRVSRDLEAVLFGFATMTQRAGEFLRAAIEEDDFIREYQSTTGSQSGNPAEVFRRFNDWTRSTSWLSPETAKTITAAIDMFSPA